MQKSVKKESSKIKNKTEKKKKNPIAANVENLKLDSRKRKLNTNIHTKRMVRLKEEESEKISVKSEIPLEKKIQNLVSHLKSPEPKTKVYIFEQVLSKCQEILENDFSKNFPLLSNNGLIELLLLLFSHIEEKSIDENAISVLFSLSIFISKEKKDIKHDFIQKGVLTHAVNLMKSESSFLNKNDVLHFIDFFTQNIEISFELSESVLDAVMKYIQLGSLKDNQNFTYFSFCPLNIIQNILTNNALKEDFIKNKIYDKLFDFILNIFHQGTDRNYVKKILENAYFILYYVIKENEDVISIVKNTKYLDFIQKTCNEESIVDTIISQLDYIIKVKEVRKDIYEYYPILKFLFDHRNNEADLVIMKLTVTTDYNNLKRIDELGAKEIVFSYLINKVNDKITEIAYLSLFHLAFYYLDNRADNTEFYNEIESNSIVRVIKEDAMNFEEGHNETIQSYAEDLYGLLFPEDYLLSEVSTNCTSGSKFPSQSRG